jgi:hypothetical protein
MIRLALVLAMLAAPALDGGDARTPIVVELFTSEGCSSCPPADALLQQLIESQPIAGATIVALGEHVDYWDRLGWRDRFSSAASTNRQQVYAARLGGDGVYTPQMVVDGRAGFVGSDARAARRAIEEARARAHGVVTIAVAVDGATAHVTVTARDLPATRDRADILVALTEDHLRTDVKGGENHGRALTHAAVAHSLLTIAEAPAGGGASGQVAVALDPAWQRDRLKVVAFVQERRSRAIVASAAAPLPR